MASSADVVEASTSDVTFFASSSARPKDYLADIAALVPLSRAPKSLQGQALFAVSTTSSMAQVASRLLRLSTVDYVHVLLASCPVCNHQGTSGLDAIRAASASVSARDFGLAVECWRQVRQLEASDARHPDATNQLVFRAIGKRGGRGHDFTSEYRPLRVNP